MLQPEYNLEDRNDSKGRLPSSLSPSKSASSPTSVSPPDSFRVSTAARPTSARPARHRVAAYLNQREFRILDALETAATRHGAKPAEMALAWALAKNGVTAPIASATSLEQTESLVRATELALTPTDMDALNAASAP